MRALAFLLLLAFATPVMAQTVPDWAAPVETEKAAEAPTNAAAPPPPPPIPVDGGLVLLALAGAGLAARKLRAS